MIPMHVHVLQDLMELCVVQVWKSIVTHVQCFLADFSYLCNQILL